MQLEDIFLARFADLTPDGLFTVVGGGVSRINATEFPWSWGIMFLLARLRLTAEEAQNQHLTAVEREAPTGQIEAIGDAAPLLPLPPEAETGPDGRFGLHFSYCLVNLLFPRPGVYKYRLKIGGREVGAAELLVT